MNIYVLSVVQFNQSVLDLIVEGRLRNDDSSGGKSTQMLKK